MNQDRDRFIERWKRHVAGVIALGGVQVKRIKATTLIEAGEQQPAEAFGGLVMDLHEQTVTLLGQLYDDLTTKVKAERK